MRPEDKKAQEKVPAEAIQQKKLAEEKRENEQKTHFQQRVNQDQVNIQLSQQPDIQNSQQPSPSNKQNSLQWMKQATVVTMKFEKGNSSKEPSSIEAELGKLKDSNIISDFKRTQNGLNIILNGGKEIGVNLKDHSITLNNFSQKIFSAVGAVIAAVGGIGLDISKLTNNDQRFSAWKGAKENNLGIGSLSQDEENQFKKVAGMQKFDLTCEKNR